MIRWHLHPFPNTQKGNIRVMKVFEKIANRVRNYIIRSFRWLVKWLLKHGIQPFAYNDVASQLQLKFTYRSLTESGKNSVNLSETGFKVFSQTDEDGILLYIFSIIGTSTKKSVEICAGDGIECNTANLIIHHGWTGLLVEGKEKLVKQGREFYRNNKYTYTYPPVFVHSWITRDNVNNVIKENGFEGEIDLLSIDMDGIDYWIWESIGCVQPRVVVVEYNDIIGPDKALTVPYKDDFDAYVYPTTSGLPNFCGASLRAFVNLAKKKGYRFVGCSHSRINAFFIRNPIGEKMIPEISIEEFFKHPKVIWGMRERFPLVKDLPWIEV